MTQKQEEIFENLIKYTIEHNGAMPSFKKLAEKSKIANTTLAQHIKYLRIKGYLEKTGKLQFTAKGFKIRMQYEIDKIK